MEIAYNYKVNISVVLRSRPAGMADVRYALMNISGRRERKELFTQERALE